MPSMVELMKDALKEEGLGLDDLDGDDWIQAKKHYEKIRRRMGIRAPQRQQDAYDFIAQLIQRVTQNSMA